MSQDRSSKKHTDHDSSALKNLGEKLVGTWRLSGGATGQSRYEWAENHKFIMHHVDIIVGRPIRGLEVIGYLKNIGEEPSEDVHSRFYSFTDGLTLDYTFELKGKHYTIWFGERGSNNFFEADFSEGNRSFQGEWQWPGGGYSAKADRID